MTDILRERDEAARGAIAKMVADIEQFGKDKIAVILLQHQMAQIIEQLRGFGEIKTLIAILQRDLDERTKQREETGKKWWSLLPPIIGALAAGVVGALVTLFLTKR